MSQHAEGSFEVRMTPLTEEDGEPEAVAEGAAALGRMALAKQFHGDLEASGRGQMLTAMSGVAGSAGYVAIERVTGRLHGRSGSFVLQHSGTMDRGAPSLAIGVVPDSGTGELAGLSGSLKINIVEGQHRYAFDYTLASPAT